MRDELALIRLLLDRRQSQAGLDANQGWTREEAWAFCIWIESHRIPRRSVRRLRTSPS
jgi:O-succinylbenzoate synthase